MEDLDDYCAEQMDRLMAAETRVLVDEVVYDWLEGRACSTQEIAEMTGEDPETIEAEVQAAYDEAEENESAA